MKKKYIILLGAIATAGMMTGCAKDDSAINEPSLKEYTFRIGNAEDASIIDMDGNEIEDTKVRFDYTTTSLMWNSGDKVGIFLVPSGSQTAEIDNQSFSVSAASYPATTADIKGAVPPLTGSQYMIHAVSPYKSTDTYSNGTITTSIPSYYNWTSRSGYISTGVPAYAMTAASDINGDIQPLVFRPPGTFLKIPIELDYSGSLIVKRILISGNNGEILYGPAEVNTSTGVPTFKSEGGNGTEISTTYINTPATDYIKQGEPLDYYIFVPCGTSSFSNGITITVYDHANRTTPHPIITTNKQISVMPGTITVLPTIKLKDFPES